MLEPLDVRERPLSAAPLITTLERKTQVEVLGRFLEFDLVRSPTGLLGWAERSR